MLPAHQPQLEPLPAVQAESSGPATWTGYRPGSRLQQIAQVAAARRAGPAAWLKSQS